MRLGIVDLEEQKDSCRCAARPLVALVGVVLRLSGDVCWGWGLGKRSEWGRVVRRGRSVGSMGVGNKVSGKAATGVLLQSGR